MLDLTDVLCLELLDVSCLPNRQGTLLPVPVNLDAGEPDARGDAIAVAPGGNAGAVGSVPPSSMPSQVSATE